MSYQIKEMYYTLQGEGHHSGRPAVFCRFAGCNLWSGREEDRKHAICNFCDTDFVGTNGINGGKFERVKELTTAIKSLWPKDSKQLPFVVLTGGEPMLQVDENLVDALHKESFFVAIETNGTILCTKSIDWICVSPKNNTKLLQTTGDELKLVYPQENAKPEKFESLNFQHFYLQPMDGKDKEKNTRDTINFCKLNPLWKLSIQTHKILDIP